MTMSDELARAHRFTHAVLVACQSCGIKHTLEAGEYDGKAFYCTDFPKCIDEKEKHMSEGDTNFSVGYEGDPNEIMSGAGTEANPIGNPGAKPGKTTAELPVGEFAAEGNPNVDVSEDTPAEEAKPAEVPQENVPAPEHEENPGIEYEEAKIHSDNNEQN